ncbi:MULTISPECIES: NADP-dependent oxidoreductase [unclassified Gemella]|uniref:NADP-dependent oxidoreductase n=1 Tax=unclassified Gemella TaxID=2624949 RepID=UPI001C059C06|nr:MULTISPECIES: NADP-dependent oxidoreductase [unclassified Gemella]MBU0279263.1 NADP-dependent oxidoreductase [Gemella sp. zg-1178]QWQ38768.1 NADP-dependent oxidoreductase [Gemella sp. zg-570]
MKVAIHTKYNKNNIKLEFKEVSKPEISFNEVLIKVLAAGVNPLDNMISRGEVKLIVPYKLPQVAGNEFVGVVEKVGKSVSNFSVGDRVFARLPLEKIGAFSEYIAVNEEALAKVPAYLSDEEAAAIPLTALTIMQALDIMNYQSGKIIFISGGTGGVGGMAIPIAKAKGLKVITNGDGSNAQRVLNLGADQFIDYKKEDYKKEDYTKILKDVDYVLDTLGGNETEKQMSIMKKGGSLVSLRAMPNGSFAKRMNLPKWKQFLFALVGKKFDKMAEKYGVTYNFIFVKSNGKQLQEVADIFTKLEIKPSVDTIFKFEDVNEALDKIANGRSRGKTVLTFKE